MRGKSRACESIIVAKKAKNITVFRIRCAGFALRIERERFLATRPFVFIVQCKRKKEKKARFCEENQEFGEFIQIKRKKR